VFWTIVVVALPWLLMLVLSLLGGGIGSPELIILATVWVVGLLWVWWPRPSRRDQP